MVSMFDSGAQEKRIRERLLARGDQLFRAPRTFIQFTGIPEADELINDIENLPHAFVIACIMDRQIKAEKAWVVPYKLSTKLGNFEFATLESLSEHDIHDLIRYPEPLHRFPDKMAKNIYSAVLLIKQEYDGDASRIWRGEPSSAEVVYRFLKFRGIGPKIATMAANILAREFKIPFRDYYSIDISADVHVKRVFRRLGLIDRDDGMDCVIYKARALAPEFPGLLDAPCWEIGRKWCQEQTLACSSCYMHDICSTAKR